MGRRQRERCGFTLDWIEWRGVVSVSESSADGLFFRRGQVVPIVQRTLELTALGRRKLLPSIVEVLKVSAVLRRHPVQLLHPTPQGFFFLRCQRLPFLVISLEPAVFIIGNQNRHLVNIFILDPNSVVLDIRLPTVS